MESSALSDCEVWAVIKFLDVEGVTGLEIHLRLNNVYDAHYSQPKISGVEVSKKIGIDMYWYFYEKYDTSINSCAVEHYN